MNAIPSNKAASFASLIAVLVFISTLLLPAFYIKDGFPKIEPVDFLLPVIFIILLLHYNLRIKIDQYKILIPILVFFLIMLLSIIVNGRISILRDHFELLKLIKFTLIVLFFSVFTNIINWDKWISITLFLAIIFNLLHYIDFLNFNKVIQIYYGAEIHITGFGLNSIGEPDTKRILGTLGNPNNNAILFLFFCIYYFKTLINQFPYLLYLSVLGLLACQSRTGFIALGVVFVIAVFLFKVPIKNVFLHLFVFTLEYLALMLIGNMYISSLGNADILKSNSVLGRLETWTILGKMILEKPFLGYGPDKLFFEQRNLYSESEYFLITWRYGFFGLFSYLWFMINTSIQSYHFKNLKFMTVLFLYTIVFLVCGLTNNPFADPKLMVLYAMVFGLALGEVSNRKLIHSTHE